MYEPTTDFVALLRLTSGVSVRSERMPGLDFVISAMARMGFITLRVAQTEPTVNKATTVWLQPAIPSWSAEGAVFLWNSGTLQFEPATPTLWQMLLATAVGGYVFQSAPDASNIIAPATSLLAVQRAAPAATALTLPALATYFLTGKKLQIVDFSTAVVAHTITLATPDGATIMQNVGWQLYSTADQLAGITLTPSPDLNAWVIAP